jgi:hypothetical protein
LFLYNCGETGDKNFIYHFKKVLEDIIVNIDLIKGKYKYLNTYIKDIQVYINELKKTYKDAFEDFMEKDFNNFFKDYFLDYQENQKNLLKTLLNLIKTFNNVKNEKNDKNKKILFYLIYHVFSKQQDLDFNMYIFKDSFGKYSDEILEFINQQYFNDPNYDECKFKDIVYYKCDKNTKYAGTILKLCPENLDLKKIGYCGSIIQSGGKKNKSKKFRKYKKINKTKSKKNTN